MCLMSYPFQTNILFNLSTKHKSKRLNNLKKNLIQSNPVPNLTQYTPTIVHDSAIVNERFNKIHTETETHFNEIKIHHIFNPFQYLQK